MDTKQITDAVTEAVKGVLAQQSDAVDVVCPLAIILSLLTLIATVVVAKCKKTPLGPTPGKMFNHATLTAGVFLSVLLFTLSLSTHNDLPPFAQFLAKTMDALRMMLPNFSVVAITDTGVQGFIDLIVCYEYLLYLVAPVTTFFNIVTLFRGTTSRLKALWQSFWRDTYLITPLNEQTLALATGIDKKHKDMDGDHGFTRKANIIFTDCSDDADAALANRAYDLGAICVSRSAEEALTGILKRHRIRVLFDGGNVSEIARARTLFYNESEHRYKNKLCIYLFSPLVSAGEMLPEQRNSCEVFLRRVDWTRNLVERTLDKYPLFLLNPSPKSAADYAADHADDKHSANVIPLTDSHAIMLQKTMLQLRRRRVVIVGAGHVGTEFLKLALSYCCIDGMRFTFDVIDSVPDPANASQCIAKPLLQASAPGLLNDEGKPATRSKVNFPCLDVRSKAYETYMVQNAPTITYVFVALGNDAMTADTAMRTRKMLERGILEDCIATQAKSLDAQKHAYRNRCRPVIVAVIDDDGLGKTLSNSTSKNLSQHIDVVGSRKSMFTFESMLLADQRNTDYKSRSAHSSREHAKYKVFAYARHRYVTKGPRDEGEPNWERIDWRQDFRATVGKEDENDPTWQAIKAYNRYCEETKALASDGSPNHEWLLCMEHDRWCAFARAEVFRQPTDDEVRVYLNAFANGNSPYRSDETGLHARLASFDELPRLSQLVKDETGQTHDFQRRHDEHIRVQKRDLTEPTGKFDS